MFMSILFSNVFQTLFSVETWPSYNSCLLYRFVQVSSELPFILILLGQETEINTGLSSRAYCLD